MVLGAKYDAPSSSCHCLFQITPKSSATATEGPSVVPQTGPVLAATNHAREILRAVGSTTRPLLILMVGTARRAALGASSRRCCSRSSNSATETATASSNEVHSLPRSLKRRSPGLAPLNCTSARYSRRVLSNRATTRSTFAFEATCGLPDVAPSARNVSDPLTADCRSSDAFPCEGLTSPGNGIDECSPPVPTSTGASAVVPSWAGWVRRL